MCERADERLTNQPSPRRPHSAPPPPPPENLPWHPGVEPFRGYGRTALFLWPGSVYVPRIMRCSGDIERGRGMERVVSVWIERAERGGSISMITIVIIGIGRE